MEIELKLLLDPQYIDALRSHPLLRQYAAAKPHEQQLVSTYYDTPDLQIRKHQAALRVRRVGNGWLQTLKGGGKVESGLHQRNEWEGPVSGAVLEPEALRAMVDADSEWGRLLGNAQLMASLEPVFTTRFTRTTSEIRLPGGEEIECALDIGTVEHTGKRTDISELELELKSGAPSSLFAFALQLLDDIPMRIGNISKAERGYALYAPEGPRIVKAAAPALTDGMSVEQGFTAITAACMAQIQGNENGVMDGRDPESVHQMRVGLRRLRSAFRLFRDVLAPPADLQEEFRWLGTQLGAARDWEVLSGSTLAAIGEAAAQDSGIAGLRQRADAVAQERRAQAAAALVSPRYTRLMLRFALWLQSDGWREGLPQENLRRLEAPLQGLADTMLAHFRRRMLKRGRHHRQHDAQALHRLRIAAKKERYAIEFFQALYPAKRVRRYVKALSALQDELGWLNDVAVADGLLRELGQQHEPAAAGFARGYLSQHAQRRRRKLGKRWKRFRQVGLPTEKHA